MDKNSNVTVKNRSAGSVSYRIPEDGIRRFFQPGETKTVPVSELEKLTFQNGGRELIASYLQVVNKEVTDELNVHTEPEYYLSEQQVADLLQTGSLDAFLDALDFAPEGVIDLIKKYAVSLPLNDVQKRDALKKKTGFDVSAALQHIQEEREETKAEPVSAPQRRVQVEEEKTSERRTTPKYNVVTK